MIHYLKQLLARPGRQELINLVRQVSDRSFPIVQQQAVSRIGTMSLAEARGYVRARARGVVRRQLEVCLTRRYAIDAALQERIGLHACERVVHLVIGEMLAATPAVRRRAA
ncbi:MAG: hypothetical protein DWQ31_10445 [Planctomycetota bacterium]|nr:MAG: hypothetical protein DWQ31_10445 [Planctomycetota bacterium]REJ98787.1 MAG: hypothetical protein DWQ35_00205 [Planctomycetota bacterium]REK27632.1 MAG: hypothetical protein DWQ42_06605 [Planctomycetota bacterium]REK43243.1 MAG: hypothetical protein DWQ46_12820 [Planctomycetota bacterium]